MSIVCNHLKKTVIEEKGFDEEYAPSSCHLESDSDSSSYSDNIPLQDLTIKIDPSAIFSNTEIIPAVGECIEGHNIDAVVEEMQTVQVAANGENSNDEIIGKKTKRRNGFEKQQKDREKHPPIGGCLLKCKNKDCSEITEEDRKKIWDKFWSLQYSVRRQWLCRHVRFCQVQKRTVQPKSTTVSTKPSENLDGDTSEEETGRSFLKNESREYFLPKPFLGYKQTKVCKKMFLGTLGY
ncbi:unnamed protein product [Brassicogethes aeneus]|uniref:Uncharacterized protein n=1 Tax=Brassicogethes aeneus TaxID=1431903 RepID=A0A9P0B9B5_BRAAE|nr:unnamed protein product [Brassicogethes aeneus]